MFPSCCSRATACSCRKSLGSGGGIPFNSKNNINGIDGDSNGDGIGTEIDTLANPAVTRIQEHYVRKVIDTVNDLDNVLYEICNEAGPYSTGMAIPHDPFDPMTTRRESPSSTRSA